VHTSSGAFDVYPGGESLVPALERFVELARDYDLIPVSIRLSGDDETPMTLWRKIGADCLLETVESEGGPGRYSLLGRGQTLSFTLSDSLVDYRMGPDLKGIEENVANPLSRTRELLGSLRIYTPKGVPAVFLSLMGFLGYEAASWIEKIPKHPRQGCIPDVRLVLPELLVGCDAFDRAIWVISFVFPGNDARKAYRQAMERLEKVMNQLQVPVEKQQMSSGMNDQVTLHRALSPEEYMESVRAVQEHIRAGDIVQGVIAQQLRIDNPPDPMTVYRRLRAQNPSPYHFYLDYGEYALVGASPEVMVKLDNGLVTIRPIAGTRPRGENPQKDQALEEELLGDEKERAEHLMLVDLARNDIGRVAVPGSVQVDEFMKVERYSHVMHLVSSVSGRLRKGKTVFDVIAASFPAGTLTGAPKVRAMEIIHEQERQARGPYGGAVVRLGLCGDFDSCITIRTVVFEGGQAFVTAGAGIVHQSVAKSEYEECMNKARASLHALGVAEDSPCLYAERGEKNGSLN